MIADEGSLKPASSNSQAKSSQGTLLGILALTITARAAQSPGEQASAAIRATADWFSRMDCEGVAGVLLDELKR